MSKTTPLRVAVLGAGPVGLEAAVYAKALGLFVSVYERGQPGGHVDRWGFVRMFTPFGMTVTPLGKQTLLREAPGREFPADADLVTGRQFRDAYLLPLAQTAALKGGLHAETRVLAVGRTGWRKGDAPDPKRPLPPFRLLVRGPDGRERFDAADAVLDCTGTFGTPNWVGDGGIPAASEVAARQHLAYWPEDISGARRGHYAGKSVVVVGGGYSAAAAVCDLAAVAEQDQATWVIWLTTAARSQPLPRLPADPLKERDRLAAKANHLAARCDGNLEYHSQAQVDEVVSQGPDQGFRITARVAGKAMTWDAERVIAHVGYRPDLSICSELRVGEPVGRVETGEPGYFVLGAKARGRDANFLLRDGHADIRRAFAVIAGKSGLDLYAGKAA